MLLKSFNDMPELGQVGLKVGNSGDVLALRKRDGDIEKQQITTLARMTFERVSLSARM